MMTPILFSLPPALTAFLLAVLATVTFLRGRRQPANFCFALLCLLGCFLNLDILIQLNAPSADTALRFTRRFYLLHPFLVPLFIHFFHAYLGIKGRNWLLMPAYGIAAVLAACSQGRLVIAAMKAFPFGYAAQAGPLYSLMAAGALFATVYNLIILSEAIRKEKRSVHKNKLKYIFTGFLSLGVLTCLNLLTRFGFALYPPGNFGFVALAIFAAGVLKYDLLDMGILIRRSILYGALSLLFAFLFAMAILIGRSFSDKTHLADSFLFTALSFTVFVVGYGPLKSRTQSIIDHLWVRPSRDYRQTIKQASRTIASVLDCEQISRLLRDTLIHSMGVEHGALFLHDASTAKYVLFAAVGRSGAIARDYRIESCNDLVRFLAAEGAPLIRRRLLGSADTPQNGSVLISMTMLNAEVIIPMVYRRRLNGFVVLGEKLSGEMYLPDDLDLLETLGHQSALAVENARAYEALNALNRDLESRVALRTSELQQALDEKERTQEQLVRSESLAAIGQLVAGVAHELNNPLASVTSLLQSAVEDLKIQESEECCNAEMIDDLQFADKELARAKSIVASLLGLTRQTQTYEEAVDLNVVVKDALRILHNRTRQKQIKIVQLLRPGLDCLQGNFANLGQVMVNIITNAIQAAPAGKGIIMLRTDRVDGDQGIQFVCEDNGPGIDASLRRDVFKPFFTTKPVGRGTGLGLYICHEIIQKHGGSITIDSARVEGAAVRVTLPLNGRG